MEPAHEATTPVLICGGGPVALTLSILLSRLGVAHMLVERRQGVNPVPRARGINCRTMEIWDRFGLTPQFEALNLPASWQQRIVYRETLAGEVIGTVPIATSAPGFCARWSPSEVQCIAQDKSDAVLLAHARGYPQADLRHGVALERFEILPDGVRAALRPVEPGASIQSVRAGWLVACDGAHSVLREQAGIGIPGAEVLDTFINAHFHADLLRWVRGLEAPLTWIMHEGLEGVFAPLDGGDFWRAQINIDPADAQGGAWDEARIVQRVRDMIGAPEAADLPIRLHSFFRYTVRAAVAERFRQGRFLLAGDAAHQIPPFGAMGMNTGVQSAHNLAWKLAAVVHGQADERLLDTYQSERQEVAHRVCRHAVGNFHRVAEIRRSRTPAQRRAAVGQARAYGNAMGLDLGVHYAHAGAFVPDDSPPPPRQDPVTDYVPCAKPGHRAPHLWLRQDGARISSLALFERQFVLLTGERGEAWQQAARVAGLPVPVRALRVGTTLGCDLQAAETAFEPLYGIEPDGAVLVRPDGHVAWRAPRALEDPAAALRRVMAQLLGR